MPGLVSHRGQWEPLGRDSFLGPRIERQKRGTGVCNHKDRKYQEAYHNTAQGEAGETKQEVERPLKGFETWPERFLRDR